MSKCPHCGETITILRSDVARLQRMGNAPYDIEVLLISCSSFDCSKVLGVLHPPQPERSHR